MAKNEDGLEAGKPVSYSDMVRVNMARKNAKPEQSKPVIKSKRPD
jgi:hypothetical protein